MRRRPAALAWAFALAACGGSDAPGAGDNDALRDALAPAADVDADADADADAGPREAGPIDMHAPEPCPWEAWDEGLVGGRVDDVVFDPRARDRVYASAGGALVRSSDGGATFEPLADGLAARALAFPADAPKVVLAATGHGLFRSNDSGATFAPLALGGLGIQSLLVHPALPARVFVGTEGAGIMRSGDGGASFGAFNVGVPRMIVTSLSAPPDDPDVALATGVLQNDHYGVGARGVILRTDDGGESWTTVNDDVVWGTRVVHCPTDPRRVAAAVRRGALLSDDGGATFARVPVLGDEDVVDVAFAAHGDCERVWLAIYTKGVFRLERGTLAGPFAGGMTLQLDRVDPRLALDPNAADGPDTVLAATHAGLFRTRDGGARWALVDAAKSLTFVHLHVHADGDAQAGGGDALWLPTWGSGLWSRTLATPWRRVELARDFTRLVTSLDARLLVGTASETMVSDDARAAFTLAPGVFNANDALALGDDVLVASQVAGVQRAARADLAAWAPSNDGLAPFPTANGELIDARALVADPRVPDRLYVALLGAGVAVSDDGGRRWATRDNALSSDRVVALAADVHGDRTRLFARVEGKGVWRSDDGAATWRGDTRGLDTLGVTAMVLDGGRLYVAEGGGGAAAGDGGGAIRVSDDGHTFDALAAWCLPVAGWGALAVAHDGDARWLVAATRGNRVVRMRVD